MQYSRCRQECREDLWREQSGRCERIGRLVVDHDHETGKVRGLLCTSCNVGLGHFQDDSSVLARAIVYLNESTPQVEVERKKRYKERYPIEPTTQAWED